VISGHRAVGMALAGTLLAVGWSKLMLYGLRTWWVDAAHDAAVDACRAGH
jgi:hypothetical protein